MKETFKPASALLVIDMLNDFVLEGAPLQVPGAQKVVPKIKEIVEEARDREVPVIYICDTHDPKDKEFEHWPPHAVKGTKGAEVIEALKPTEKDYIVTKRRYSGFFLTDLELVLRDLKVEHLVLTGLLTDICVFQTAADAFQRGYQVTVLKDCVMALSEEDHSWALKQMERLFGAVVV